MMYYLSVFREIDTSFWNISIILKSTNYNSILIKSFQFLKNPLIITTFQKLFKKIGKIKKKQDKEINFINIINIIINKYLFIN